MTTAKTAPTVAAAVASTLNSRKITIKDINEIMDGLAIVNKIMNGIAVRLIKIADNELTVPDEPKIVVPE
jgi:hypothetical protein